MELSRMDVLDLVDPQSGSMARIAPNLGFNCFEFRANVAGEIVDVLDSSPDFAAGKERPSGHGIPLLFPFPNRIRGGRFAWNGRSFEIPETNASYDHTGNAIHGFCLDRPWRVLSTGKDFAVGVFELSKDAPDRLSYWPTDFRIEVRYSVRGASLKADIQITNPSGIALPWGFGTHPYFKLPLGANSQPTRCLIQVPASEEWELIDCVPTGRRLPVTESKDLREGEYFDVLKLDDVLTGLPPQRQVTESTILDEEAGLQIVQRCDPIFRDVVVYTPARRKAICLEPYTCATDAINLQARRVDAGWRILDPGAEQRMWIEIAAGEIIV